MNFPDKKDLLLRAIYFKPGISVVLGGNYQPMTYWELTKYPDVLIHECENGDYWFFTPWDGRGREVKAGDVGWRLWEPHGTESKLTEPAMAKRRAAEKAYSDKFGKRAK